MLQVRWQAVGGSIYLEANSKKKETKYDLIRRDRGGFQEAFGRKGGTRIGGRISQIPMNCERSDSVASNRRAETNCVVGGLCRIHGKRGVSAQRKAILSSRIFSTN